MNRTILDIHILQTVPPSNVNRDDTGSPKSAFYGGVKRARVSSQAWKRATRTAFRDYLDPSELGERSKRLVELVGDEIRRLCSDAAGNPEAAKQWAQERAHAVIAATGIKLAEPRNKKGAPHESGYLMFLSRQQIEALARLAAESEAEIDKKAAQALVKNKNSIDLALFGRMVADVSDLNVDAAAQVAHALSTHAVENEFDYFTAVDDHKAADADEDAGAGMLGTVEFNSSTMYRYATVDVNRLRENLGDDEATVRAVEAFVQAFVRSMPTGKLNTFANRTLPDAVVARVRDDQSVSYAGAFEEPVASGTGRVARSAAKLAAYAGAIEAAFGGALAATWVVRVGEATAPLDGLGAQVSFQGLVQGVGEIVRERLAGSQ